MFFFESCGKEVCEEGGPLLCLHLHWYPNSSHHHVKGTSLGPFLLRLNQIACILKTLCIWFLVFVKAVLTTCVKNCILPYLGLQWYPSSSPPFVDQALHMLLFSLSLKSICQVFKTFRYMVSCFLQVVARWDVKIVHSFFLRPSMLPQVLTTLC